jgi:transposase InsO family protein
MREHQGEFSIGSMCRIFGVTRSGFHAFCSRPESARAKEDAELAEQIREAFEKSRKSYGPIRIRRALRSRGRRVSKKRVERLMRRQGLRVSVPSRYVATTDSKHCEPIAPNLLERGFTATAPNQKWAGDITYIPTAEGWLYLAVFLDLFSRKVIGWAMSNRIDARLTRGALVMALRDRRPTGSLIVHSDRGVQYAAGDYRQILADWSITPSMSRRGNCYDNAVSESFFATIKKDEVHRTTYRTRAEARSRLFDYIEVFYNRTRLHSTLGYVSPVEFEEAWTRNNLTAEPMTVGDSLPTREAHTGSGDPVSCETVAGFFNNLCPL